MKLLLIIIFYQIQFSQIYYSREEFSIINPPIWHVSFYNIESLNKDMFFLLFELSMFKMQDTNFLAYGITPDMMLQKDSLYIENRFNGIYHKKGYLFKSQKKVIDNKTYIFLHDKKKEVFIYGISDKGKDFFVFFHKKYSITDESYYDKIVSSLQIH